MKKRIASIRVKNFKEIIKSEQDKTIHIALNDAQYRLGYETDSGKKRFDFISPNPMIKNWLDELNFKDHFCFIDTNELESSLCEKYCCTHVTGFYLFKFEKFDIKHDEVGFDIEWKPDWRKSVIALNGFSSGKECPEKTGWNFAIQKMKEMKIQRVKIFVDKHQNDLKALSQDLPVNWNYYYVSSDRGATLFNKIFKRLDRMINIVAKKDPVNFEKVDLERYLMGNDDHLKY